jgi:2,4-dienoyl-CoA reductase (NADPH2)
MPEQTDNPSNKKTINQTVPRFHRIGGAKLAAELDAKRAIKEGAELAVSL